MHSDFLSINSVKMCNKEVYNINFRNFFNPTRLEVPLDKIFNTRVYTGNLRQLSIDWSKFGDALLFTTYYFVNQCLNEY